MTSPLLHLATPAHWRACLDAGVIAPTVAEFLHLSTPGQVALPAGRLYAGRQDMLLLALDPDRIGVEVRWEAGLPTDPPELRFPHAYGSVPTSAVLAVLPYRPRPDGGFDAPLLPVLDAAARQAVFEPSYVRRAASAEIPVTGGVAVRTERVPASHKHNSLMIDGETDAPTVAADADHALAGLAHHQVTLLGDHHAGTAAALGTTGWQVQPLVGMAGPAGGTRGPAEVVDVATLRPVWDAEWRRHLPDVDADTIAQLTDRLLAEEQVIDLRPLAIVLDGVVVASAVLRIDGATAELDGVETVPEHRGHGYGELLLADARAVAAEAGCDLVTVIAAADARPRHWYSRRGFTEVNRLWSVGRQGIMARG